MVSLQEEDLKPLPERRAAVAQTPTRGKRGNTVAQVHSSLDAHG